jgi:hypothetical protein
MMKFKYYKIQLNCKSSLRAERSARCGGVKPVCRLGKQSLSWLVRIQADCFALAYQPLQWLAMTGGYYFTFIIFFVTISFPTCNLQK